MSRIMTQIQNPTPKTDCQQQHQIQHYLLKQERSNSKRHVYLSELIVSHILHIGSQNVEDHVDSYTNAAENQIKINLTEVRGGRPTVMNDGPRKITGLKPNVHEMVGWSSPISDITDGKQEDSSCIAKFFIFLHFEITVGPADNPIRNQPQSCVFCWSMLRFDGETSADQHYRYLWVVML